MRIALALAVLWAATACGGGEPAARPAPSSLAPRATEALPAARATGVAGEVERAVLAHYAGINQASSTGDTRALRATYTDECTACEAFADRLDGLVAKGQRLDGAQDVVTEVRVSADGGAAASAVVTYTITPHRLLDAQGMVVGTFPSTQERTDLALRRQPDGTWRVVASIDAMA